MKPKILFLVLILSAAMPDITSAQALSVQVEGEQFVNDTNATITSFSGKQNSGKIYLKWTVVNQHSDGLYLVYRSTDGVNFENIGNKPGVGVPISKEMTYYFMDNTPVLGTAYYKIVHMGNNKTFLSNDKIAVCCENVELVLK